jgi:pimeloyl-ACP methyl ester carboxylesterase
MLMQNLRFYGKPPYSLAVIHGGPGGGGEMAPVARKLSCDYGVLEPIQTAASLEGQVRELVRVIKKFSSLPVYLIGFSWGAWLGFIIAARYPILVKKLILVGCGPFEEKYVSVIHERRLSRLQTDERMEFKSLLRALGSSATTDKDGALARLGELAFKADAYDPLTEKGADAAQINWHGDIYQNVWDDAVKMRRSGELLRLAEHIRCPVLAIHGDHDPHPVEGVEKPLSTVLKDFNLVVLKKCGHMPWIEQQAREQFYSVLNIALR